MRTTDSWKYLALTTLGLLILIQLIRPSTANPPVSPNQEMSAHLSLNPGVELIFQRSCNDCHSNRTVWPWYSRVAPASWLVASDVNDGRRRMNFSEWGAYPPQKTNKLLGEICKEVQEGDMPPFQYRPMHPGSRLTQEDQQQVCQWVADTKRAISSRAVSAQ